MADGGGDHQQETRRGGQGGCQSARCHQCDHPAGQLRDLGIGEHEDVAVHIDLVFRLARRVGQKPFAVAAGLPGELRLARIGRPGTVLDDAVTVLVHPADEADILPVLQPARRFLIGGVVDRIDEVDAGERGDRRSGGVEQGDEDERPQGRHAGVRHLGHGEEAHDHMRQARGAHHQREGDGEDIDHRFRPVRIGGETKIDQGRVQLLQHRDAGPVSHSRAEAELRDRVAGHQDRDENRRHQIGEDQHAILRHLRVGDALHAAQHRIDEDDRHADDDTEGDVHLEEAGEHDADAAHLPRHIGEGNEDQADDADNARRRRVIPLADEVGHRELAELAQIGCQQQGQQHIAARPAHEIDRAVIARKGDDARHGDERGCAHPVGRRRHAVGDRMHAAAGDIELAGGPGTRPDGNADIKREAGADEDVDKGLCVHVTASYSSSSTP